ncbi:MAG: MFS transporter [Bdellovibrionales bacterium]|nr:MFS transporter [Bdellovibrionales bacterium]
MAAFFPVFFKEYWRSGVEVTQSTFELGMGNSVASLCIAVSAPILGAMADAGRRKKRFLGLFTALGVLTTAGLFFAPASDWQWALAFYALAAMGFAGSNIFYDSLLVSVSGRQKMDFVSGLGYALGYLGGSLLLVVNVLMATKPEWFGFSSAAEGIRYSFLTVSLWWAIFSLPLFFMVQEDGAASTLSYGQLIAKSYRQLALTIRSVGQHKALLLFLIAYIFYIDGVNTMIKMAVDYGKALGFPTDNLITALLITNFVAFPATVAFGFFGERFGARKGIYLALAIYIVATSWGHYMQQVYEFYFLAGAIGLVQGGIQSLSRSYYAQMVPEGQEAEYFGFFNTVGKFSAIFGPVLVGYVSQATNNPRSSILVILAFFAVGIILLRFHSKTLNQLPEKTP